MTYKWCVVAQCSNSSLKTPQKLFINLPKDIKRRKKWLELARRDPRLISSRTTIYMCEDHFDLQNDMENFMEYYIMGSVRSIRMRPGSFPSKFECQPDRRKQGPTGTNTHPLTIKKQRLQIIDDCERFTGSFESPSTSTGTSVGSRTADELDEHLSNDDDFSKSSHQTSLTTDKDKGRAHVHKGYYCNECSNEISGFRYVCVQCTDFDLCSACEAKGLHGLHYVLRVPRSRPSEKITSMLENIRKELFKLENTVETIKTEIKEELDPEEAMQIIYFKSSEPMDYQSKHESAKTRTINEMETQDDEPQTVTDNPNQREIEDFANKDDNADTFVATLTHTTRTSIEENNARHIKDAVEDGRCDVFEHKEADHSSFVTTNLCDPGKGQLKAVVPLRGSAVGDFTVLAGGRKDVRAGRARSTAQLKPTTALLQTQLGAAASAKLCRPAVSTSS